MKSISYMVFIFFLCIGMGIGCKEEDSAQEESLSSQEIERVDKQEGIEKEEKPVIPEAKDKVIHEKKEDISTIKEEPVIPAGNTYYVSPDGLDTNEGTEELPWPLAKANAEVKPGDAVILMDGMYNIPIKPVSSGKKGAPIVYKAASGEKPLFTGGLSIDLYRKSFVTVEGITAKNIGRFLYAEQSSHITISGCHFENAKGWESCRLKNMGNFFRFTNNLVKKGSDLLTIQGGNHHLIEGNTFDTASHTALVLMGVHYSVVRNNRITNPTQKIMEVFTTRRREYPDPQRKTEHVLIENNVFEISGKSGRYAGIQYAGNKTILRRNIFRKCGTGWYCMAYPSEGDGPEAQYNQSNRFYNNVIYDCGMPAKRGHAGPGIFFILHKGGDFGDQVLVNNIIFWNRLIPSKGTFWTLPGAAQTTQIYFSDLAGPQHVRMFNNNIICEKPGEVVIWSSKMKKGFTLKQLEVKFSNYAWNNMENDPQFVDADKGDFRLKQSSPCIDAGGPLSRTKAAGKGKMIEVEDALFFSDGFGIVEPDVIRVGNEKVKIVSVDYELNEITIDKDISWNKGASVTLDYNGEGPDIGAFEYGVNR